MRLKDTESIRQSYAHVYLSPHMDDAVFSCGGRIAMQVGRGERVLVVTAFSEGGEGGRPSGIFSALAGELFGRREEEETALGRLGADFLLLGYPDGIFRCRLPLLRYGLHLRARDRLAFLIEPLRTDMERICRAASSRHLYLPLGIGQHIDHHLAFLIGVDMSREAGDPYAVSFYEDIPYALIPHALHYRFRAIGLPAPIPQTIRRSFARKILDIYRTVSCIPTLTMNRPLGKLAVLIGLTAAILYMETVIRPSGGIAAPRLLPEAVDVTPFIEQKLAAMMDYRSQATLFFGSLGELRRSLGQYSLDMGGSAGHYWERYWNTIGGK